MADVAPTFYVYAWSDIKTGTVIYRARDTNPPHWIGIYDNNGGSSPCAFKTGYYNVAAGAVLDPVPLDTCAKLLALELPRGTDVASIILARHLRTVAIHVKHTR